MTEDLGALDLLPEAVVLVDDTGRIRHVNDRAGALLGLSADAIGRPLDQVLPIRQASEQLWVAPSSRPSVGDRLPERLARVVVRGRERSVSVSGRWSRGGLLLTFRNAGHRERLDAVRGDVVATVSHEIRSPLTSVKGFTRTMLNRWDRFSDEQKIAMLETIDTDADRVTRLLGELLDVSRIDAGRLQLHRRPVAVDRLVRSVADKMCHREPEIDRHIEVVVDEDVPQVHADPDKIEQVLTNLVENALTHGKEGTVRLTVAAEQGTVRISVADEGPGVPADQQHLVFQKFGRARESRSGGTGLGLYITRGLVEAHGGEVWIDPDVVRGATFHVTLPARRAAS